MDDKQEMELRDRLRKAEGQAFTLRYLLKSIFDTAQNFILIGRVVLYVGSVGMSWFYLKDHALAVGIAVSLTVAHLLMYFSEYLEDKKRKLEKAEE